MLRSRLRAAAALLALVAGVGVAPGAAATAAPAGVVASCSNSACPDPDGWKAARWDAHAGYPSNGGVVNGANCTNYVAWRLMSTQGFTAAELSGLGNARTWDTRAAAKGYKVDRYPSVGAVAHWDNNHVAYVEQVNSDGTIVISESNVWVGNPNARMWLRHRVVAASAVDHFIHFRPANPEGARTVLAPGDFDGDGLDDMLGITGDGRVMLYRGDGHGAFLDPEGTRIAKGWNTLGTVFAAGDFSGDGHPDVMAILKDGRLFLFRGNGTGGLVTGKTQVASGWQSLDAAFSPGDFPGDGNSDVIVLRPDGSLALFSGNGTGGFTGKSVIFASGFGTAILVGSTGDVDGDAKADVIAVWGDGTAKLYRGDGAGGLLDMTADAGTDVAYGWNTVNSFAGAGDVTGDGIPDLITLDPDSQLFLHTRDGGQFIETGIELSVTW